MNLIGLSLNIKINELLTYCIALGWWEVLFWLVKMSLSLSLTLIEEKNTLVFLSHPLTKSHRKPFQCFVTLTHFCPHADRPWKPLLDPACLNLTSDLSSAREAKRSTTLGQQALSPSVDLCWSVNQTFYSN